MSFLPSKSIDGVLCSSIIITGQVTLTQRPNFNLIKLNKLVDLKSLEMGHDICFHLKHHYSDIPFNQSKINFN